MAILLELLTFSLSVLFMLVGSEHTLVPLSSTLAFIGDATLCPLGNSSVPMKLSAGRKSTGEEEDKSWATLSSVCFCLRVSFPFVFFWTVLSRFRVRLTLDRNAFLRRKAEKIRIIRYNCMILNFYSAIVVYISR